MGKPKILWISLNAPTVRADKAGGATFNYYFKEFYFDDNFDVKVIAQINNDLQLMNLEEEDTFYLRRKSDFLDKIKRLSSLESKYNPVNRNANLISNQMESFVKRTIKLLDRHGFTPEVVILEWTQCVVLARMIRRLLPKAYIIASEHDVTFVGYGRKSDFYSGIKKYIWRWKAFWEKKIELNSLDACDLIMPHNPENIELLKRENVNKSFQWLVPYFNNMKDCIRYPQNKDILFFGAMGRPENYLSAIWFIEQVMPLLEDTDMRFVVLGSNPPDQLEAYASDRVIITGFVDSILPYFESACCLVAPLLLGAGIKVKILEGLSSGIPVITNKIGIEGISAERGSAYVHAEKPEEYAKCIRLALSGKLEKIGDSGRKYIQECYDVQKSVNIYKKQLLLFDTDKRTSF